jgi:DnaK suppressor protein
MEKIQSTKTIAKKLEEQRGILLARLGRKQESIQTGDVLNPDKDDQVMAFRKNNRDKRLLSRTEQQLHDIDLALERLESGSYGICTKCGENIQPARLEIMPTAALCITCQRIEDNK